MCAGCQGASHSSYLCLILLYDYNHVFVENIELLCRYNTQPWDLNNPPSNCLLSFQPLHPGLSLSIVCHPVLYHFPHVGCVGPKVMQLTGLLVTSENTDLFFYLIFLSTTKKIDLMRPLYPDCWSRIDVSGRPIFYQHAHNRGQNHDSCCWFYWIFLFCCFGKSTGRRERQRKKKRQIPNSIG